MVISLAKVISRERVVTSLVPAIIVKAATSLVLVTIAKTAISLVKVATNREKVVTSPVPAIIVKVAISKEKEVINLVKAATIAVLVLPATILMQSTA